MIDFTKLKDLLVEKKCVSSNDYGKEDPFIGIYWEDLIDIINHCDSTKWISVDEALPSYNIKVLVCFEPAFGARKIFITTRGPENIIVYEKNKFYIEQSGEVTHWMPVPEFPKGGKE